MCRRTSRGPRSPSASSWCTCQRSVISRCVSGALRATRAPRLTQLALQVPKNLKLLAVPLFELYQNERYGQEIASVPVCLSRFHINLLRTSDDADANK